MAVMISNTGNPYQSLRELVGRSERYQPAGLSQRAVERALGWEKRGRLSLIERGLVPTADEHRALMAYYNDLIQGTEPTS